MGYISINPKLCLCAWLLNTLMLVCDIDLNYVCVLGCSEEPNLSPGVLNEATLSHPCAHTTNRAQHHRQQFQHPRQGGPGAAQDHHEIHLHKGKQSSKQWQVQPQSYMVQSPF